MEYVCCRDVLQTSQNTDVNRNEQSSLLFTRDVLRTSLRGSIVPWHMKYVCCRDVLQTSQNTGVHRNEQRCKNLSLHLPLRLLPSAGLPALQAGRGRAQHP